MGPRAGLDGWGNLAHTGIRFLDRPVRSESLYRLSYRGSSASYKNDNIDSGIDVSKKPVASVFKFSRHLDLGNLKVKGQLCSELQAPLVWPHVATVRTQGPSIVWPHVATDRTQGPSITPLCETSEPSWDKNIYVCLNRASYWCLTYLLDILLTYLLILLTHLLTYLLILLTYLLILRVLNYSLACLFYLITYLLAYFTYLLTCLFYFINHFLTCLFYLITYLLAYFTYSLIYLLILLTYLLAYFT